MAGSGKGLGRGGAKSSLTSRLPPPVTLLLRLYKHDDYLDIGGHAYTVLESALGQCVVVEPETIHQRGLSCIPVAQVGMSLPDRSDVLLQTPLPLACIRTTMAAGHGALHTLF
mgnify:CR=1 FL=1